MTPTRTIGLAGLLASTILTAPALAWGQDAAPTAIPASPADQDAVSTIDDIVVRGRFVPDVKRETSEVANILSVEDIQRAGDSEIGEALARVTGLSIVGDGYVYVRGLGDRYSSVVLDGSTLPSPEPLKRVVPLDLFPTSLVSNALIQKTYSVQYPGEFSGGLIALSTRAVPNERFFQFGASIAAHSETTGKDGLYWDAGGGLSNIGIADNSLNLPNFIGIDPSLESFQGNPAMLRAAGLSLRNIWSMDADSNLPDFGFNLSGAEIIDLPNGVRLGAFLAADYDYQVRNREGVRNSFEAGGAPADRFSPGACADSGLSNAVDCGSRRTEQEYALNALGAFGIQFNENHEIKLTTLLLRKTRQQAEIDRGTDIDTPFDVVSFQRLNWIEQQMNANQLSGKHVFFMPLALDRLQIDWRGAYSTASRDTPYRREYTYGLESDNVFRLLPGNASNRTFFSALEDENVEAGLDLTLSGAVAGREVTLRAGGLYQDRQRDFASRRYYFYQAPGVIVSPELRSYVPEIIFSPDNIGGGDGGFTLNDITDPSDFFDATMEVMAGYGSAEVQLMSTLRVTAGVRYEDSSQQVNSFVPRGFAGEGDPVRAILDQDFWLPAATATWEFADNMQLRAGYSKTINRPDLRELSNALFLDDDSGTLERGNPNLKIAEIENWDLRWEWYFGERQSATIGLFHKTFENPIERTYQPIGEGFGRSFQNAREATLSGVEAEIDYTLPMDRWAPTVGWFEQNQLFVVANVTWSDSEVTADAYTRRLQGQSEWLANLQFGFENETARRRANLLINYQGERISDAGIITGATRLPDVMETPPVLVDLVAAQTFTVAGRDYDVSFKAENLLGEEYRRFQTFADGSEGVVEGYKLGTTVSLGLSTRF